MSAIWRYDNPLSQASMSAVLALFAGHGRSRRFPRFEEANAALKRRLSLQSRRQSAKNVVLLVGDGLGLATLTAARIFKGQRQGQPGESSHLAWEKFSAVALAKVCHENW
ncbi:hypothetical protein J6590_088723 [Homalodisca vitripennis]|nr:hypothetical protein J6590_088723 [Homalodisca vitripennis]